MVEGGLMEERYPDLADISNENTFFVKGYNGQVSFDGDFVTILRKGSLGFISQGLKGEKQIPLSALTSIQLKLGGLMFNGYIQFATSSGENVGGLSQATSDENSIVFTERKNSAFQKLREVVNEARLSKEGSHDVQASPEESHASQLTKLADLYGQGLLSEKEFQDAKAKILGNDA